MRITAPNGRRSWGRTGRSARGAPIESTRWRCTREALDAILVDRVRSLPVDFREQAASPTLVVSGDRVLGVEAIDADARRQTLRAPLTIAADGRASVVAQRLGLRRPHRLQRMALVTYVEDVPGLGRFGEIFVDPPDYAILNPCRAGSRQSQRRGAAGARRAVERSPRRLLRRPREASSAPRAAHRRRRAGSLRSGRWVLSRTGSIRPASAACCMVGDATGFYDPFSGEGIFNGLRARSWPWRPPCSALRVGDVSARALAGLRPRPATGPRDKERVTHALQILISHRRLANLAAQLLVRRPRLLDLLLGVLGDFVPARALLPGILAR